jgi:hypothetical protein
VHHANVAHEADTERRMLVEDGFASEARPLRAPYDSKLDARDTRADDVEILGGAL